MTTDQKLVLLLAIPMVPFWLYWLRSDRRTSRARAMENHPAGGNR
jgi:hypothetical protein